MNIWMPHLEAPIKASVCQIRDAVYEAVYDVVQEGTIHQTP